MEVASGAVLRAGRQRKGNLLPAVRRVEVSAERSGLARGRRPARITRNVWRLALRVDLADIEA